MPSLLRNRARGLSVAFKHRLSLGKRLDGGGNASFESSKAGKPLGLFSLQGLSGLEQHYANGAHLHWQDGFVSPYASAHPWEDFAETFAHYLHIADTLEMAKAFGVRVEPGAAGADSLSADVAFDPYHAGSIDELIAAWLPLAFAVNSINRSMGQPDLYPFVLSPAVIGKLGYIHGLVHR
jgi:hypothetical protein